MLTLFAAPKPFLVDHTRTIQRNAIASWIRLNPQPEIILMGNDEGVAEVAAEFGVRHIPDVEVNGYGTPLISSMFEIAQRESSGSHVAYVNSDIILLNDFLTTLQEVPFERFLLVGQRWNLDITEAIAFDSPDWEAQLRARVKESGKLEGPQAIDYFVFPRGLYRDMPAFAVGRPAWDNWMLYKAFSLNVPVLNATDLITAVHQNHDYNHHPQGKFGVWGGPESEINLKLAGGWEYGCFNLNLATWQFTHQGLQRPEWVKQNFDQYVEQLSLAQPQIKNQVAAFKRQWETETMTQKTKQR